MNNQNKLINLRKEMEYYQEVHDSEGASAAYRNYLEGLILGLYRAEHILEELVKDEQTKPIA